MRRIIIKGHRDFKDVTQALKLADTDALTGLYNRRWLYSYYNALNKDIHLNVMFIDIDNFKRVNDIYGHSMGDEVIKFVGNLIKEHTGDGLVTRIGGDEFVALIDGKYTKEDVTAIARNMINDISESDFRKDIMSLISLSIGIILDQSVNTSLDDVLYKCDSAMYQAKSDGKNRYVVYTTLEKSVEISKNIEAEMEGALEAGDFILYLQPKVNMITSRLFGAEALSRWNHRIDGIRNPEKYIPLFEKNGFIVKLDMYMFEQVCRLKSKWISEGASYAHIPISINMSRLHLYRKNFTDLLLEITDKYNISPKELEIEITETVFLRDSKELILVVDKLHKCGFSVSIDDFGSGYSALNMLKDIPVNIIKIDKEFLRMSANDTRGKKVIKNVIAMCKDLKLDIVAEGVENQQQIDLLTNFGCEIAQGFYYSKPLSFADFEEYASMHYVANIDTIKFSFNNNFISDDGKYQGIFVGRNYSFSSGISPTTRSVYIGGGEQLSNYLELPRNILHNDSYSISFWLKPEKLNAWTAAIFGEYENGFFAYCPLAWEGHACYRIRDGRQSEGWYDTSSVSLWKNTWTHVVITYNSITEKASVYINGQPVNTIDNVPTLYSLKHLYLGTDVYQEAYQGYICELLFGNAVMSASEIYDLHQSYVTKPDFTGFPLPKETTA